MKNSTTKNALYKTMNGFTLLEVLVTIGIIAVIALLVAQAFFTTTRSNTKSEILREVKQNGDYAIEVMGRMIRNAQYISSTCDPTGTTLSSLVIINPDGRTTTFECYTDGTIPRIASVSAQREYLTGTNVSLGGDTCGAGGMVFLCSKQADLPANVQINFTLSQVGNPLGVSDLGSAPFQTSITLRN